MRFNLRVVRAGCQSGPHDLQERDLLRRQRPQSIRSEITCEIVAAGVGEGVAAEVNDAALPLAAKFSAEVVDDAEAQARVQQRQKRAPRRPPRHGRRGRLGSSELVDQPVAREHPVRVQQQ
jgi:hypothetical protein